MELMYLARNATYTPWWGELVNKYGCRGPFHHRRYPLGNLCQFGRSWQSDTPRRADVHERAC